MAGTREKVKMATVDAITVCGLAGHIWEEKSEVEMVCARCECSQPNTKANRIQDYIFEFKPMQDFRAAKRQMKFYSAISRGKKVVYRASFWTRLKNWTRKLRLNYKEEETV